MFERHEEQSAPVQLAVPAEVSGCQLEAEPTRELRLLAQSAYRLIWVQTVERERLAAIVAETAHELGVPLAVWTCATGLQPLGATCVDERTADPVAALATLAATDGPLMVLAEGLAEFAEKDAHVRTLLAQIADRSSVTLVLGEPTDAVPSAIAPSTAVYRLPRPDRARIAAHVRERVNQLQRAGTRNALDAAGMQDLVDALGGLTLEDIDHIVREAAMNDGVLDATDMPIVEQLRASRLEQSGAVTLTRATQGLDWVAGLEDFKRWVGRRRPVLDAQAAAFGLTPARGVLLTGVPGCGKSFAVKALSLTWGLPLLRLDAGALFGKLVGESERNLRQAFGVAEALAPSVLWIDELEKAFSASGSSEADGGLGFRMLGMLLTWMQERTAPVFLAATANQIDALPAELTRQGRFDEIFFVDLPQAAERQHLFMLQLAQRGRDHTRFDCAALAAATDGFSGAEIEQAVVNALYDAYAAGHDLDTPTILAELRTTVPMSRSAPERIERIRAWGHDHARAA